MSKKTLFDDDSETEEVSFETENEYAKKYDNWREKEELHKLEQKYGSKALKSDASSSSDSEDDDDEPPEVSEETEAQFLKTLALLKTKDPRIYDPEFKFFDESAEKVGEPKPVEKTVTFEDSDDDDDSDDGNIFKVEKKAEIQPEPSKRADRKEKKEGKLKDFLIGKAEHIDDEVEQDLAPLKALWSDPKIDDGEAFLRDYILNKKYLEDGDPGEVEDKLRDDEDLEEDERRVEEQGHFERAYNFRFEEPDDEYLKRYPRTVASTRPRDDRRSKKRAELRARKEEEKRRKMDDIARLRALKLKEIQEKIAKIKEVTGNDELAFREEDIEGDFDPEEHDRRMKALFDEEFYGGVDDQKPVFPDLDEELEIENWEKYDEETYKEGNQDAQEDDNGPHCEDEDFNMDADYDPKRARASLLEEIQSTLGKKRRNRKKKSKLAQLLASEKPKYIPTVVDKTYDEYMEEYYKMDCEDVIGGDLPTRFKYREVEPNDFGLTVEEILLADDNELTQWVPLKKIVKHRPRDVERGDVTTYRQKAADVTLKRKILPSLFKNLPEEPEIAVPIEEATKKKKKKKKKNKEQVEELLENADEIKPNDNDNKEQNGETSSGKESKRKKKHKEVMDNAEDIETNALDNNGPSNKANDSKEGKKKKRKELKEDTTDVKQSEITEMEAKKTQDSLKKNKKIAKDATNTQEDNDEQQSKVEDNVDMNNLNGKTKKKKKKHKSDGFVVENVKKVEPSHTGQEGIKNNNKKRNLKRKLDAQNQGPNKKHKKYDSKKINKEFKTSDNATSNNPLNRLSDERLKAYGLNPKKYKNFLKYKKF